MYAFSGGLPPIVRGASQQVRLPAGGGYSWGVRVGRGVQVTGGKVGQSGHVKRVVALLAAAPVRADQSTFRRGRSAGRPSGDHPADPPDTGFRLHQVVFPDPDHTPAVSTQNTICPGVAASVFKQLPTPEDLARARAGRAGRCAGCHGASTEPAPGWRVDRAAVPKAAVDKQGDSERRKDEVRPDSDLLSPFTGKADFRVSPPSGNPCISQGAGHGHFRGPVASRAYTRHDLRPLGFGENVRHGLQLADSAELRKMPNDERHFRAVGETFRLPTTPLAGSAACFNRADQRALELHEKRPPENGPRVLPRLPTKSRVDVRRIAARPTGAA